MRLCFVNCLLLASIAVALPNGRQKRDLSFLRNFISPTIFGQRQINIQPPPVIDTETRYKLYRLPGYDNMFIKAMPKSPVVQEFLYPEVKPVNINAFGSVVGTKSNDDTIVALKGVNNLLSSGILRGKHNEMLKETIVPMFPTLNVRENAGQEVFRTAPMVETREQKVAEVIRPFEEKVNVQGPLEPQYSYVQMENIQPQMMYTAHYNPDVKVVETIEKKSEFPMCVRKRINEVIQLGADPYRVAPVHAVFPYQAPPVVDISYPRVETNPYMQNPSYPRLIEQMGTVAKLGLSPKPLEIVQTPHNVRPSVKTQVINSYPLPLYKPPHLHVGLKTNDNSHAGKVDDVLNFDTRIGISQTSGPIPPQYIAHTTKKDLIQETKDKTMDKTSTHNDIGPNNNVSNGMIPISVYKQQNNPNTAKLVKLEDTVKTNTNIKSNVKMPSYYYYVPPIINSEASKTQETKLKDGVHTNKVIANPESVTESVTRSSTTAHIEHSLKEYIENVQHYAYQQKNADGSSMNVRGGKNGVSVDVKENNAKRGDIPDE